MAASKRGTRIPEEVLVAEYPHVVPGTLHFIESERKQAVSIHCVDCGAERTVRTSDLFQVKRCELCSLKARRAKAREKRAAKRES